MKECVDRTFHFSLRRKGSSSRIFFPMLSFTLALRLGKRKNKIKLTWEMGTPNQHRMWPCCLHSFYRVWGRIPFLTFACAFPPSSPAPPRVALFLELAFVYYYALEPLESPKWISWWYRVGELPMWCVRLQSRLKELISAAYQFSIYLSYLSGLEVQS